MGGQACVFYGAAEFSRDVDLAIMADTHNIRCLKAALHELDAEVIAVPEFNESFLHRGLAVHFRCKAPGVQGMRIDVMTVMRGVDPFPTLWERRTTLEITDIEVDLLSLPDLVKAKKTQRSKDWPMLERLIEAHWFQHRSSPTPQRIHFWLCECRTPEILLDLANLFPSQTAALQPERPVLSAAIQNNLADIERHLENERAIEVAADKAYWEPLRQELERLRREHS